MSRNPLPSASVGSKRHSAAVNKSAYTDNIQRALWIPYISI